MTGHETGFLAVTATQMVENLIGLAERIWARLDEQATVELPAGVGPDIGWELKAAVEAAEDLKQQLNGARVCLADLIDAYDRHTTGNEQHQRLDPIAERAETRRAETGPGAPSEGDPSRGAAVGGRTDRTALGNTRQLLPSDDHDREPK